MGDGLFRGVDIALITCGGICSTIVIRVYGAVRVLDLAGRRSSLIIA
jgi:hypothetical protein